MSTLTKESRIPVFGWLAAGGFFVLCLLFVWQYGVNVPYWDEWEFIRRFADVYSGHAAWWELLTVRHNEHMIGVPYVLMAFQYMLTGLNTKAQLITGVFLQAVAFLMLVRLLVKNVAVQERGVWLVLLAGLMFSLSQHKNFLWAFQTAWFLVSVCLVGALMFLGKALEQESPGQRISETLLASVFSVVATFSSSQGVLVWGVGAIYIFARSDFNFKSSLTEPVFRIWSLMAVVTGAVFLFFWLHGTGNNTPPPFAFSIWMALKIFLGALGGIFGDVIIGSANAVIVLGGLVLAFFGVALRRVVRSATPSQHATSVALIVFGLSFTVLMALARCRYGISAAVDSHYRSYVLLALCGVVTIFYSAEKLNGALDHFSKWALPGVLALAFFSGSFDALVKGAAWRRDQGISAHVLLHANTEPTLLIERLIYGRADVVVSLASFLKKNALSSFKDGEGSVPDAAKEYMSPPESMLALKDKYPGSAEAIERLWAVYLAGDDLRTAFDAQTPDFADRLVSWAFGATRDGHYLSAYLKPYASLYQQISEAERASAYTIEK